MKAAIGDFVESFVSDQTVTLAFRYKLSSTVEF